MDDNKKDKENELISDFEISEISNEAKENPISVIANEAQNISVTIKNLGTKYLDTKERQNKRAHEAEMKRLEIEEQRVKNEAKRIANNKSQQNFGNILVILGAATFITLGVFKLLKMETAVFIMAVMFAAPGLNSLKNYLNPSRS